jgi:hypothetical protein
LALLLLLRRPLLPLRAAADARHAQVVMLGDASVGKTCLVQRFTERDFTAFGTPTAGASFRYKLCEYRGLRVNLGIWVRARAPPPARLRCGPAGRLTRAARRTWPGRAHTTRCRPFTAATRAPR